MEVKALHAIAKKLLGNESIRKEVFKVLKDEPELLNLDDGSFDTRPNPSVRQRRTAAKVIFDASHSGSGSIPDDIDIEPHADTLTDPGSPWNDIGEDMGDVLEVSKAWQHELQEEPRSLYVVQGPGATAGQQGCPKPTLFDILQSFATKAINALGSFAQGAWDFMRRSAEMCARMFQNVAAWCQRSLSYLQSRFGALPRWRRLSIYAFAVMMSIVGMISTMS